MVDSDGQPWEPVPGPDPLDELVVADKATWSDGNDYSVGQTISGVSATFTGGTDRDYLPFTYSTQGDKLLTLGSIVPGLHMVTLHK